MEFLSPTGEMLRLFIELVRLAVAIEDSHLTRQLSDLVEEVEFLRIELLAIENYFQCTPSNMNLSSHEKAPFKDCHDGAYAHAVKSKKLVEDQGKTNPMTVRLLVLERGRLDFDVETVDIMSLQNRRLAIRAINPRGEVQLSSLTTALSAQRPLLFASTWMKSPSVAHLWERTDLPFTLPMIYKDQAYAIYLF
ncbi:glutathione S-transferase domain-containing protein [Penicillium capsulatum]|uniref:Glutathione S-transferase domain-containing protein n=1 Tax=Penicillium capsulatum TaxID=69766 RepID=A0A9W9I7P5_9EURO|nr:glutathione S-transferase domain-containing protein [Penicillium capsulatum]KAJ6136548.1 glutathione S-transferase domain-containing protein [Penicillium capsulatum]